MKYPTAALLLFVSSVMPAVGPAPAPEATRLGDQHAKTVQPRHIKLLLAGHEQNWPYAKYELHELQEAFERSVKVWPRFRGLPLGGMVDAIAKGPMDELAKAIEGKDEVAFDAAYEKLTDGCNACPTRIFGRQNREGDQRTFDFDGALSCSPTFSSTSALSRW